MKLKILELTKENSSEYIDDVAMLEKKVLETMEKEGKIGQLFITGKEDILEYVKSEENTVMIGVDEKNRVQSAVYITQGQKSFTYNDITKYFKVGEEYKKYIKSQYSENSKYQKDMLETYKNKIKAYKYAKDRIIKEHPEYENIEEFLKGELQENGFHEKSILREKWNQYMAEYILQNGTKQEQENYEKFFWINANDISKEMDRNINANNFNKDVGEYENWLKNQKEYENILENATLKIYEEPTFSVKKYFTANTKNSIEIDTYLTSPDKRHSGTARILVYEGIKKHINKFFENTENKEIFLCSTLHRENLSSKYVSEFFGLKDSLFVNRRQGRDREVHICRIDKNEAKQYLDKTENKLAVLYGYNPRNKNISLEEQINIIKEQLKYEKEEMKRLNKIRHSNCKYKGNVKDIQSKAQKIIKLKEKCKEIQLKDEKGER
mgnify:FL=1